MIEGLIEKGYAYPVQSGDVYFRVRRDDGLRQALRAQAGRYAGRFAD